MIGSLSGGGSCDIDENGVITNQGDCRFIPSALEQTATTSLMSFHWLDSVCKFISRVNFDEENRLISVTITLGDQIFRSNQS